MSSLDRFAAAKLAALDVMGLRRSMAETARGDFPHVMREGKHLISFSCNDYLGLSRHPAVIAAAIAAAQIHGAGSCASRLVTGNHPLYAELEAKLAALKGTPAACVFGSGYLANIGTVGVLAGPDDLVLVDELAHACLFAGARLSRATMLRFRHNDADNVAALLADHRASHPHALVVTETVFSMDGDRAPLEALAALCELNDAWLMSDDAHGLGLPSCDTTAAALQMGTLSKALGSYGGYACASRPVIDLLKTRARSLVYATALPPACVAAASAALDIVAGDPALAAAPLARARLFTRRLALPDAESAIVPLILGAPEAALAASARLAEQGFLVAAIRPPTVPPGTARLRFTFCALHAEADVERLAASVQALLKPKPISCPASS